MIKSIACFKVGGYSLKALLVMLRILLPCSLDSQSFMFEIDKYEVECATGKSDFECFNHPPNVLVSRGCRAFKHSESSKYHISRNKTTLPTLASNASPVIYFLSICILPIPPCPNAHFKDRSTLLSQLIHFLESPIFEKSQQLIIHTTERFCPCPAPAL